MIQMAEVAHMYKLSRRNGHPETTKVLHGLLIHGLSNQQREIMTLLACSKSIKCLDVVGELGISRNVAQIALRRLADYGLVDYREVAHGARVAYEWYMTNGHKE